MPRRGERNYTKPRPTNESEKVVGGCPICEHSIYWMDGYQFCSCESCHSGGVVIRNGVARRLYKEA